ncbi:unnamed protein product [Rhizophagus irregularis]|nr:unnamed protein product [Rhizophagus irregularis]
MESKRTDTLWIPSDLGFQFQYSKDPKWRNGSVLQYSKSIKYGKFRSERWTKGLWELPDEFLRTGLEGPCSNILNRNAKMNSRTRLWVEGNKGKEKTKMKGEGEDEREG